MTYKIKFAGKYNDSLSCKNLLIIRLLDVICFTTPEYKHSFSPDAYWWIIYKDKEPVGYCGLEIDKGWAFLSRAGILPKHRGLGLQKSLISVREKWCRRNNINKIKTYVFINNKSSIANLKKLNYDEYIPTKIWGLPLEKAIYMRKYLC